MSQAQETQVAASRAPRAVATKTAGSSHGPITRLMSPSDLGHVVKPFVFLDFFEMNMAAGGTQGLHPHSGIGTITVVTKGAMAFNAPGSGQGLINYGGLEWLRAGNGVWHGNEMSPSANQLMQGFQLWVALPPELENGPTEAQFIEAAKVPQVGPARVIAGQYGGATSPAHSPDGLTYLLVTLAPDETWTFTPPEGHDVAFIALSEGQAQAAGEPVAKGQMAVFEPGQQPIQVRAGDRGATFVLGSAVPHPHDLVLGHYSVHTSAQALRTGEARIIELRPR